MPDEFRNWKRAEKRWYRGAVARFRLAVRGAAAGTRALGRAARRKTSFLVMPESGGRARALRLSNGTLAALSALLLALAGGTVFSVANHAMLAARLSDARRDLDAARRDLDALRDGTEALAGAATRFETQLSLALGERRAGSREVLEVAGLSGILPSGYGEGSGIAERELARIRSISGMLEESAPSLERVGELLAGQKRIMSEIPNIWPIRGGLGHISMYFGQNENPFSGGQWYLHNGIDISTFRSGDQILATASGRVASLGYDPGLGLFVILQHSHGFYTRYGHLQAVRVQKGQLVEQGQTIGILGNSGKSTGPHLHYEVHLGTSVIDPLRFLNITSTGAAK